MCLLHQPLPHQKMENEKGKLFYQDLNNNLLIKLFVYIIIFTSHIWEFKAMKIIRYFAYDVN